MAEERERLEAEEKDDAEGHRVPHREDLTGDDVEGHNRNRVDVSGVDEDDVEGHPLRKV